MAESSMMDGAEIIQHLPIGVFTVDRLWMLTSWNARMVAWTGISQDQAIGRSLGEVLPRLAETDNLSRLQPVMDGWPPVVFSWQLHHDLYPKGPGPRHEIAASYTIASRLAGRGGILFSVEDYTEVSRLLRAARSEVGRRRNAEAMLQRALEAKDEIVRESNHRIKNNLSMVVSLVSLEEERAPNDSARRFLADIGSRVRSIGLLHELLYSRPAEEDPRLDEYLSRLATSIVSTYLGEAGIERLELDLAPLRLPAGLSIKAGLILVELLTNALKYGGRPGEAPRIGVSLSGGEAGGVGAAELLVTDDGPGFAPGWREEGKTLGLVLIEAFAEELGGSVEFLGGPGGRVLVSFPLPAARL